MKGITIGICIVAFLVLIAIMNNHLRIQILQKEKIKLEIANLKLKKEKTILEITLLKYEIHGYNSNPQ